MQHLPTRTALLLLSIVSLGSSGCTQGALSRIDTNGDPIAPDGSVIDPSDGGTGSVDPDDPRRPGNPDPETPDPETPAPLYPTATIGTRCTGGSLQQYLVLSTEPADCETHAAAFTGGDPAQFVAMPVTDPERFQATTTMCADGTCEEADIQVALEADGTRGDWSAEIGGVLHSGSFSATECDFDAFAPPASPSPVDGLSLSEVALYQGVKITLARNGVATTPNAPIIAGREALIRLFVEPDASWTPREVVARLELGDGEPIEARGMVSGPSSDGDGASTLNLFVPGERVTSDVDISVGIYDIEPECVGGAEASRARFPAEGTATLPARTNGGPLRIVVVPVRYNADGSGRLPDTSQANMDRFRDRIMAMFPLEGLELSVRQQPMTTNTRMFPNGDGWGTVLNQCVQERDRDGASSNTYYYCMVSPADTFRNFCQGRCVAGLGFVPSARNTVNRVSMGLGYAGSEDTFVHEVGHTLGRSHAPCGDVEGADGNYPYQGGSIGVWGYDILTRELKNPSQHRDILGYCSPKWISDYTFTEVFDRLADTRLTASQVTGPSQRYQSVVVNTDGTLSWGGEIETRTPPSGEHLGARWQGATVSRTVDAIYTRFDHVDGGIVYVPVDGAASGASLELSGLGALTR